MRAYLLWRFERALAMAKMWAARAERRRDAYEEMYGELPAAPRGTPGDRLTEVGDE